MGNQAKRKRENRTLTVDFNDEATYHRLCRDGRAFIEFVVAFIISVGFQLKHKCSCPNGFRLTRHSHYLRVRINGLTIWRIQCTTCRAVFTVFAQKAKKTENNRSLAQRLRRFIEQVTLIAGAENGQRVKRWIGRKKDGWYAIFEEPSIPKTSALIDQAHNALARKLFMMKGFHHKKGCQESFLKGLAILYNLIPYQRRAKNAGKCGIQVEGGKLPTDDWLLNLQILTSGGFQ